MKDRNRNARRRTSQVWRNALSVVNPDIVKMAEMFKALKFTAPKRMRLVNFIGYGEMPVPMDYKYPQAVVGDTMKDRNRNARLIE